MREGGWEMMRRRGEGENREGEKREGEKRAGEID